MHWLDLIIIKKADIILWLLKIEQKLNKILIPCIKLYKIEYLD